MAYGLSDENILKIIDIFESLPEISEAILYGSRAMGKYRKGSDIDITLKGNLTFNHLLKLYNMMEDSNLPYTFDLSIYKDITNPSLLDHIHRVGIVFYQK
ncbi:MAG TPA: nucleotidyltransferase domain-containing protein [Flavobacterium sp.]|jgi:predicted nucleotidyltransferase